MSQHTIEECEKYPLRIIKVPYAAKWTERMKDGFQLPETSGTSPVSADAAAGGRGDAQPVAPIELAADWTFSSDYVCTLSSAAMDGGSQGGHVQRARSLPSLEVQGAQEARRFQSIQPAVAGEAAGGSGGWRVQAVERSGVDYDLLRRQDEPILFYDEMLLYQVRVNITNNAMLQRLALLSGWFPFIPLVMVSYESNKLILTYPLTSTFLP